MEMVLPYVWAFLIGGFICMLGQILIITTNMTSARILVTFELLGVVLEALTLFKPIAAFAGAGITVPIVGFGALLARGAISAARSKSVLGIFTGGLEAAAGGVASAVFFAFIFALIFKARTKKS